MEHLDDIVFDARGLVPVVTQEAEGGAVLMLAWANREAIERTLQSREAHYWSRSREALWRKGATSGHTQRVVELRLDCDGDAVLYRVEQVGPACHTGKHSCFHRPLGEAAAPGAAPEGGHRPGPEAGAGDLAGALALLQSVVDDRLSRLPEGSYVSRLHASGLGQVGQKVIEEAGETVVAALQGEDAELPQEAADLLFHLTVLLRERGVGLEAVAGVLLARHRERTAGRAAGTDDAP